MKKGAYILSIFLSWLLLTAFTVHLPPKVSLRIEQQNCFEGKPISIIIAIDHMQSDVVDASSFTISGNPLQVREVGTRAVGAFMSSQTPGDDAFITSQYSASLAPRMAGIYDVGPVDVMIQGSLFRSNSITINVLEAISTRDFKIESTIQSPRTIYPGQKIQVMYQLFFRKNIQMLREELPLIDLEGFLPLSSPKVTDTALGDEYFQERIEREFRAINPGEFQFSPSIIEGMYYADRGGKRELLPPLMTSKEAGRTVVVTPFPEKGKPSFFDGALGAFTWRGRIIGSNQVKVEGYIEVEWRVTGRGDIDTVRLPALSDDTYFNSRFSIEGATREVREDDSTKVFYLYLRPKMVGIRAVPGFQFASFDPVLKEYIVGVCKPIALGVKEAEPGEEKQEKPVVASSHHLLPYDPVLFQIVDEDIPLSLEGVWGFCVLLVVIGAFEKRYFDARRQKVHVRKSKDLYYKAFAKRRQPKVAGTLLKETLLLRLVEVGLLENEALSTDELSNKGIVGEVKRIVQAIDENLFGKSGDVTPFDTIWKDSSLVYHAMKSMPEVTKKDEK